MDISDPDFAQIGSHALKLAIAYLLALPIAWNREQGGNSAGLRTFPLVAIGACGYMITGLQVMTDEEAHSRIVYGIITGIGFVGGGAILKHGATVHGTATAASIWNTGAMGVAVAWGRYEIAIVLSAMNWLTLQIFTPLKHKKEKDAPVERENESEDET